jgi:hypothetical protein
MKWNRPTNKTYETVNLQEDCCCWYIQNRVYYDLGRKNMMPQCSLTRRDCHCFRIDEWKNLIFQSKIKDCALNNRVRNLVQLVVLGRGRFNRLRNLSVKDKDYLMYAFKKTNMRNFGCWSQEAKFLEGHLRNVAALLFTESCRKDKACPMKALLPEYDVI